MSKPSQVCQHELLPAMPTNPESFFSKLEETTGDYTAERLRSKRPDDYKLVITMLANGWGSQKIQDEFHRLDKKLSKHTVKAVRAIEGETIDRLRERLAGEAFVAADDYRAAAILLLDEIMADPNRRKKLTVRDVQSLEVASGIAVQNGQLLAGLPTGRIEIDNLRQPDHEDFNRQLARLPSVSIAPVTHLVGEKSAQKEADGAQSVTQSEPVPPAPTVRPVPTAVQPATDSQSDANEDKPA